MHRTVVNPNIDDELDEMKRTYNGMEDLLSHTSRIIANSIPEEHTLNLNVLFFPQIGFLISMPLDPRTGAAVYEGGEAGQELWERKFSTAQRVYYKDFRMRELDERIGDIYAEICGMTRRKSQRFNPIKPSVQTRRLRSYTILLKECWNTRACLIRYRISVAS